MKIFLAPVAAMALASCVTTGEATAADGTDVRLGQTAYVDGPKIRPVEILEDSRCPMNARCIWAGRVRLKVVWIRGDGREKAVELTLGEPTPVADGALTLTSVRPERITNKEIKPRDYRFSFEFAGGL